MPVNTKIIVKHHQTMIMLIIICFLMMVITACASEEEPKTIVVISTGTPTSTPTTSPTNTATLPKDVPTVTPSPSSTPTPTPTSIYLLEDNFDNNNNQWQLSTADNVEQIIDDGKLTLRFDALSKAVAWTNVDKRFNDFSLEVDTVYKEGSKNHEYGVLVRQQDDENFYQFAFVNNTFNVWKYEGGEWIKLQDNTPADAIKPLGETNRLKLIAVGDRFQFFANNKLLADVSDSTFSAGKIGLFASLSEPGKAEVAFDNLIIDLADEETFVDEKPQPVIRPVVVSSPIYQLAFTKYENSTHSLFIADTNGNNQQLIFTHAAGPSFSPDKQRLFFFGEAGVNQQVRENRVVCEFGTISDGIVAIDLPSPLRDICEVQYDAWFCQRKGVDLQAEPSDVCTANSISVYQNLDWKEGTARWASASPDNYAVAFDARPGGEWRIYFRSMLGTSQAFRFELIGEQGSWSPTGQQMVYRSGRNNQTGLWVSNRDDTGHTNLTISGTDSFPTWSPDGQIIAFSREVDGNWDIYTVNIDGSNLQRLTDAPGHDILPVYTPSGEIIFRSARTGSWGIWKMNGDGTGQTEIISNANVGPDWVYSRMDVK
ncbi:MAG: PD40 domain-containing protein [Anaerolineae bacterium]|nr:PD40 domain-containing protein [Anaerolineae bacterium]